MTFAKSTFRFLAIAVFGGTLGSLEAAISVYTTEASFRLAAGETGGDGYDDFDNTDITISPISRNAGDFSYSASVSHTSFYGAGSVDDPALSTNYAYETITFYNFSSGVVGFGGNFFGSNIAGLFQVGDVELTATDEDGHATYLIQGATVSGFLGFIATKPLISVTLIASQPGIDVWPTADNVVLASARPPAPPTTTVPEPATFGTIFSALILGATFANRRRRAKA